MNWNDLRYFLHVARSGGLTEASRSLGTSPSTVSRRITALEMALSTKLFTRHARGYELTGKGKQILTRIENMEQELALLRHKVHDHDEVPTGRVRLATTLTLANRLVVPALPVFKATYPGITLEILTSSQNVDLDRREADIALRVSRPNRGRLAIRRVGSLTYGIYGSRSFVEEQCPRQSPHDLSNCSFILWDDAFRNIPMARWLEKHLKQPKISLVTNDLTTQVSAVKNGLGLALLPTFCVTPEDDLVCVMAPQDTFRQDLYLVTHDEVRRTARVRAVSSFLAEVLKSDAPKLAGCEAV